MSNKRDLLNYLQFLQESGFLYAEGVDPELLLADRPRVAPSTLPRELRADVPRAHPVPTPPPVTAAGIVTRNPSAPLVDESLSYEDRVLKLGQLAEQAEMCRSCTLGKLRTQAVFGDGSPMAKIVFVGEGPGAEEDARGLPFVGRAGLLLNKMIEAIGFKREEVYICNTVKCRPTGNRDPLPDEKGACEHFLVAQLSILQPQILVALGSHAAQYLCRSEETIGRLRGRWHSYHGIPLLATYHPAFLLRSPQFKVKSWEDFQMIHAKYTELNPDDPRKLWSRGG